VTLSENDGCSRKDPFRPGQKYRVIKAFRALRDSFEEGELLTYQKRSYSRYDSQTGFLFSDSEGKRRVIDLHDDESTEVITSRLEAMD